MTKSKNTKQSYLAKIISNATDKQWWLLGVALIVTVLVYAKVIGYNFLYTWDDFDYITDNPDVQSLNFENLGKYFSEFYAGNYQPLTLLLYSIEYLFGNGSAAVFHGVNIFIHIINSYLVFKLIRKLSPQNNFVALFTAAFFAIHPMHIESVAWISEFKDVLYSFFFLRGLILYMNFLQMKEVKMLVSIFIFFLLSCLSKSAAVVFPLVLILFDYYTGRKFTLRVIVEKIPFLIISLIFGVVAMYSQKGAIKELAPVMTIVEQISVISFSFCSYILKIFVPLSLSAYYLYPSEIGHSALPIWYYLSIPLVIGLFIGVGYSIRRNKHLIFGFLFFLINIILVLQIIPVGGASMADRYSYIPSIGLLFVAGIGISHLLTLPKLKQYSKSVVSMIVILFFAFALLANNRTTVWANDEILFTDVIEKYPDCYVAYSIRGLCKNLAGDYQGAISDETKAIELNPQYLKAYNLRAGVKYATGDFKGALTDYEFVLKNGTKDVDGYSNCGALKSALSDFQGALADFNIAISLNPTLADSYFKRSIVYYNMENYPAALNDLNKAIELKPDFKDAIQSRNEIMALLNK
ncbi:MAG: hypothetical protein WCL70_09000 [Paludibacter sp.]